jgi:hypothetical protein
VGSNLAKRFREGPLYELVIVALALSASLLVAMLLHRFVEGPRDDGLAKNRQAISDDLTRRDVSYVLFANRIDRHQLTSFQNESLSPKAAVKADPTLNLAWIHLIQ